MKYVICHNCDSKFEEENLVGLYPNIPDLLNRLEPGAEVPAGECQCGSLAYYCDTPKKLYIAPVIYTVSGWVPIRADNMEEARKIANTMNEYGIHQDQIEDAETCSECLIEEIDEFDE